MDERGAFTREEIQTQPEAWSTGLEVLKGLRKELKPFFHAGKYAQVIFTGCGSTYYLSLAAAALLQGLTGQCARAWPASELWFYPGSSYPASGRVLLVAVSRSGETTETLRACETFKTDGRGDIITLSCYPDQPLATMGALNLILPSGAEKSVAQTRAFSTLYLATVAMAILWSGRVDLYGELERLPAVGKLILEKYAPLTRQLGQDMSLDRFFFLGSGPRYGLACELNLKMKEMSLTFSEPFHFPEFRHGPKSMVTPSTLMVGLISELNHAQEWAVLDDMRHLGGRILTLGEEKCDISFHSSLDEAVRNILTLPAGQMVAFERSLAKGLNPDQPTNLDTVVKI